MPPLNTRIIKWKPFVVNRCKYDLFRIIPEFNRIYTHFVQSIQSRRGRRIGKNDRTTTMRNRLNTVSPTPRGYYTDAA